MTRSEPTGPRIAWRCLITPWSLGLVGAFVAAMSMLHDTARIVRRGADVAQRVAEARAQLVADAAALAAFDEPASRELVASSGDRAAVDLRAGAVVVETRLANGATYCFEGRELPGAPPRALSLRLTCNAQSGDLAGATPLDATEVPRLDAFALQQASRPAAVSLLRRDHGVGLLHLQAGTDADDFVCQDARRPVDLTAAGELLVVPGNLWIEGGACPLEVLLPHDLVIVVQGNLYLGRSLRVRGAGRLLLVATPSPAGMSFVDADGNGRWSEGDTLLDGTRFRGPIEGAGNVYCGWRSAGARIECASGLVVFGQLHLLADTQVAGPVVLAHGLTLLAPTARLQAGGEWRFHPERDLVPGFVTSGQPRPSLLQRRAGGTSAATPAAAKQPLYLSGPPR